MALTFKAGLHLQEHKEATQGESIKRLPPPKEVTIPLLQHLGAPAKAIVEPKAEVILGEKIGEPQGFVSAAVHASISGVVRAVRELPAPPAGRRVASIIIERKEIEEQPDFKSSVVTLDKLTPEDIRAAVAEAGIVGLGGAAFPSQVKLSPPEEKPVDTVILNGCECEPYLTCDHRLMLERAEEALFGLKAIMRAVEAPRAFIGIENNKPDAIQVMQKICQEEENIDVAVLKTKYPQGGEKMLIEAVLARRVPLGGLPMDVGALVHNVGTAVAIAECLTSGKPLMERVVTVVGSGVREPANVLVPIGTPLRDVIESCGGLSDTAAQVILGGPMMGFAQAALDTPVVKGTCGILVLERDEVLPFEETPCIRCGRCVDVCPVFVVPSDLARFAKAADIGRLMEYDVMNCCECGCCAYVCPARIPLVHLLRLGKQLVQTAAKKS